MKVSLKLLTFLFLLCLATSTVSAQSKTRKKRNVASAICRVASVPKGMVVVGYKPNPTCDQGMEMVVKRPAISEVVCTDSPVPEEYRVEAVQGSPACAGNPLANAMSITRATTFYGIRPGMTPEQVEAVLGRPEKVFRGTKTTLGKGTTRTYPALYKSLFVYFDEKSMVFDYEEIDR